MRAQGSGHMIGVSSAAGITGFPLVGLYSATKFGLEGLYECLALELEPFGVHVTILEPSDFRTSFRNSCRRRAQPIAAYEERFAANLERDVAAHVRQRGGRPGARRGGADEPWSITPARRCASRSATAPSTSARRTTAACSRSGARRSGSRAPPISPRSSEASAR